MNKILLAIKLVRWLLFNYVLLFVALFFYLNMEFIIIEPRLRNLGGAKNCMRIVNSE